MLAFAESAIAGASPTNLLIAPFGASCVLLFSVPESPLTQPRNLLGGHLIGGSSGLCFRSLATGNSPYSWLAPGLACACTVLLMTLTNTIHPAGGATALVAVPTRDSGLVETGFIFLAVPLLLG